MKKILVLAALAALVASPSFAIIAGSAHDLSAYAPTSGEMCVFCHTPHGADTSVLKAPLWNRSTALATGVYLGVDLETAQTLAAVNATDAPLCLSCHDGSVGETLKNEPNAGATDALAYVFGSAAANLGTDMSNDHPVGMSYAAAQLTDGQLNVKTAVEGVLGAGAVSYGAGDDMWCSSCHDVHGVTGVSTFLRIDNTSSALCTTCHAK
jgi:predicted CXXCH cytochrome family protein